MGPRFARSHNSKEESLNLILINKISHPFKLLKNYSQIKI